MIEIENKEDVEFLVGVGLATTEAPEIAKVGYDAIEVRDLIHDALHQNRNYDPTRILQSAIPRAGRGTPYVPVFKYLNEIGIHDEESYKKSGLNLDKWAKYNPENLRLKTYKSGFAKRQVSVDGRNYKKLPA